MDHADPTLCRALVVGGGMAGLATALALGRALPRGQLPLVLLEQSEAFSEVGAGLQLGPNATRVLHGWGLESALRACAAYPEALSVRDALSGAERGRLRLGERARLQYGAPYATVHRADLHRLLLEAVRADGEVDTRLAQRLQSYQDQADGVTLHTEAGAAFQAPVLLGCDGLWSRVRAQGWGDGPPRFSGHLAYRGLVRMDEVPASARRNEVTAWLGPRLHAVHYPVRGGEWLNVVVVVHGDLPPQAHAWDNAAHRTDLRRALGATCAGLLELIDRVPEWRLWPLYGREPMTGADQHARGRVALLGDAAHPMRPYLAQGAAMALEDAWTLQACLNGATAPDWPVVLQRWAEVRWPRNAWVQARSRRHGTVFHARGPLRLGRDAAMRLLGERLLDVPRLYLGPPPP